MILILHSNITLIIRNHYILFHHEDSYSTVSPHNRWFDITSLVLVSLVTEIITFVFWIILDIQIVLQCLL